MSQSFKQILLVFLLSAYTAAHAEKLLTGDSAAPTGKTFSFNVSEKALSGVDTLYVARNDASTGATTAPSNYAVSAVLKNTDAFVPLTPEKVYLDGVKDSTNPLIGEKISTMGLFKDAPLVVRSDAPEHLYWIASGSRSIEVEVVKAENVKDAQGATNSDGSTTAGIIKVAGAGSYILAAVKKNGGDFGEAGGGIALLNMPGSSLSQLPAVTSDTGTKALGIDPTTAYLKITNDLASIDTSIVDIHWDATLQRAYICVKATGDSGATDGARGVLMGYLETIARTSGGDYVLDSNGNRIYDVKLKFAHFAPAAAFSGTTYIVGAVGSSVVSEIRKVRTMHTTTGVSYLIALGNSASDGNTQTTVSALPLVNKQPSVTDSSWATDTGHGVLASKTINAGTNLKEYFTTVGEVSLFKGRAFQVPASATSHLTAQTDTAAQVGGAVAPGNVLDMQVHKDTVFVAVAGNSGETKVFSSQALLDANGAIKAWTPWRAVTRPVTNSHTIYGMGYQKATGNLYTLQGASTSTIDTVKTTVWSAGSQDGLLGGTTSDSSVGFAQLLTNSFAQTEGGIQGLFDFPRQTTAFSQTAGERTSLMIATGYKKIVLVEAGQDDGSNNFVPNVGSFSHADNITVTDGAIDTARTANTKMITVSGGALDTVGAISTATILNETTNGGYIIVGGVGGVAILRASGGAGWAAGDLQKAFENIGTNLSFASIGTYSNVRKVVADGQFLYVLTNKTFDRIAASQLSGSITPTVLATPADLGLSSFESFSDVLVSSKLALLATSSGLYRTGNSKNISTETSASDVDWTKITLTEGPNPITRLSAAATTNLEIDFAQQTGGGMVYVLASSVAQQLSSVYRLTVADISSSAITDTTVQLVPDEQIQSTTGPFAHLGAYRNYFVTDGALSTVSRSQHLSTAALLQSFPEGMGAGGYFAPRRANTITLPDERTNVGDRVRNFALGSLIVPTENGLQILE